MTTVLHWETWAHGFLEDYFKAVVFGEISYSGSDFGEISYSSSDFGEITDTGGGNFFEREGFRWIA
jgi:hypothetical protein